ncbi:MAG: SH3 domain-containing protein, partial [Terrisporobacter sp.]
SMKKGWLTLGDKKYYLNDAGARVIGKVKIDNKEYNFDKYGLLINIQQGWVTKDGKRYYMNAKGERVRYLQNIDGKTYYFDGDGEMVTGWLRYVNNNEWHYFGQDGSMKKGWLTLGDKKYYLNDDGARVNYLQNIDEKTYYFDGDGEMVTGWLRYVNNNEWHYFGQDGSMKKGWLTLGDKKYYLNDDGARVNYLQNIDEKTYYFDGDGEMVTGWLRYVNNNEWHYFGQDGSMKKGWLTLGDKKYYLNDDGARVNYLQNIDRKTYYFSGNGEMVTGWVKYSNNSEWHYFNKDGSMHKGWLNVDGKKYYFNKEGARVIGQIEINQEIYQFDNNGILQDNIFAEGKLTNYTMNLRARPSLDSEVITTMPPNSKVEIFGREMGDLNYYHVRYIKNGHIHHGYVSIYLNGNTAVQVYEDDKNGDYLGILSEKYESNGNPGCISSGEGDYGGKSYGAWQLSSKLGSLNNFIDWLAYKNHGFYKDLIDARKLDNGLNYGNHFDKEWRYIAKNNYNEFYNLQHEYTKITFYDDLIRRLKNSGEYTSVLNNFAVENVIWSTAVQHGGYGAYKIIGPLTHITNPEKFIIDIYNERGRRNSNGDLVYFPNCSKSVQEAVASRYTREREDAISIYKDSL